jgi:lipopolysaccharide export LptBFGC system permease protein LptF
MPAFAGMTVKFVLVLVLVIVIVFVIVVVIVVEILASHGGSEAQRTQRISIINLLCRGSKF